MFLTDGEYRARPTAISLFAWGIYQSRANVLDKKFGTDRLADDPRCGYRQGRLA